MKKLFFVSLLLTTVAISSCKKEEEVVPINPIFGTWHLMEIIIDETPQQYSQLEGLALSPSYFYIDWEIIFLEDNETFQIKRNRLLEDVLTFEGTHTIQENEVILNFDDDNPDETYVYDETKKTLERVLEDMEIDFPVSDSTFVTVEATTRWVYRKF